MKTYLVSLICLIFFAVSVYAAPGDTPTDQTNIVWQLAAGGNTATLLTAMTAPVTRVAGNSGLDKDAFAPWMQIQISQSAGLLYPVYPISVFHEYLAHIEGFEFNRSRVLANSAPPDSPSVSGSSILCSADATGQERTPKLYKWNYVIFTESAIAGVLSDTTWTFLDVPVGIYVLAFDGGLPTLFLTVN